MSMIFLRMMIIKLKERKMSKAVSIVLIVIILLSLNSLSSAADYYVDSINGDNSNTGSLVDDAWQTITHAIENAESTSDDPAFIFIAPGTYDMALGETFPLNMDHDFQLIGSDRETTIIDATGSGISVIYSKYAQNVKIEGLTITGGEGSQFEDVIRGGGLYLDTSVINITDCLIKGNYANYGGGIYFRESTVDIIDCTITENTASDEVDLASGAGIFSSDSTGLIENCIISSNTAPIGAGISVGLDSPFIKNCQITGNTALMADGYGSGAAVFCASTDINIEETVFENNRSNFGGALMILESALSLDSCTFANNTAETGTDAGGSGGAIYIEEPAKDPSTISDCEFSDNAALWGGGIYANYSKMVIESCLFENNIAQEQNESGGAGGAARFRNSTSTLENCEFKLNSASWGAGISSISSELEFKGSIFSENLVAKSGGGIYVGDESIISFVESKFYDNQARWGAGIRIDENSKVTCSASEFKNNVAKRLGNEGGPGGGIFVSESSKLTADDTLFEENTAVWGAGISSADNAKLTITNSSFLYNDAIRMGDTGSVGGGIEMDDSTLDISNCCFEGNTAKWSAGLDADTCKIVASECSFTSNLAENSGGGIFLGENSQAEMNRMSFVDNEARWGGGIFMDGASSLNMVNSQFHSNNAYLNEEYGGTGGGLQVEEESTLSLVNCLLTNNTAHYIGNGLYHESGGSSKIANCTFLGNNVYANDISTSNIINSIFWNLGTDIISGPLTVTYSNIEGGYDGEGNVEQEPAFTTGPRGDYYLSCMAAGDDCSSPCIDAGSPEGIEGFNHKDYITRCDGVVDTGTVDMGFHYIPHINFGLGVSPVKFAYKVGDEISLNLDLETAPVDTTSDVYLLLMTPEGKFLPGMTWSPGLKPLVSGITLPADLAIESSPLFTFTLPDTNPPVDDPGWYTFYITALKPGTVDFISNIASTAFQVK